MKVLKTVLGLGVMLTSLAAVANPRAEVVAKAQALQTVAVNLASLQYCYCPNTRNSLYNIQELAVDVELEGRFGTAQTATAKMKDIVRELIGMRNFVKFIQSRSIRLKIKRDISVAVNELGFAVMGTNWILVAAAPAPGGDEADAEVAADLELNGVDANLDAEPAAEFE